MKRDITQNRYFNKKVLQISLSICSLFLIIACTTEEDEIKLIDLSTYDDYHMKYTVYYNEVIGEFANYQINYLYVNSLNDDVVSSAQISNLITIDRDSTDYFHINKAYKYAGIKLLPQSNIKGFKFQLYKTNTPLEPLIYIERELISPSEEINISYNFETEETSFLPLD